MKLPGNTVLTFSVYLLSCNFLHAQVDPPDELGGSLTDKLDEKNSKRRSLEQWL